MGNGDNGVAISAPNNTVGGTTAAARNIISGNGVVGVGIGDAAMGNKVIGNYIGTDATGTKELGNLFGVNIEDASNNVIGGTTAGERNLISGNDYHGVNIYDPGATGNRIMGNYVGTDASGTKALGNTVDGVRLFDAPGNTVGGTTAGARNVIAANGGDGVEIHGDTATGNRVLSNSIFSNGDLGIDLNGDGPTANDPGDVDTGPNGLQNKPVVTSAKTGALKTTVNARLNSTPNKTFTVQFFSNPSGTADEGKKLLGQKSVTTGRLGNAVFSFTPAQKLGVGRTVTATATNPAGSTSEFSAPKAVASS